MRAVMVAQKLKRTKKDTRLCCSYADAERVVHHSRSLFIKCNSLWNESVIENKDVCKYFGVIIDSELNFKAFINHVESKIAKNVGILSRLRYLFPSSTLLLLYFSLIQSHLLYGLLLRGSTFPSYLTNLLRLQNKALRITSDSNYRASITPVCHKLRILKISDMRNECTNTLEIHCTLILARFFKK